MSLDTNRDHRHFLGNAAIGFLLLVALSYAQTVTPTGANASVTSSVPATTDPAANGPKG